MNDVLRAELPIELADELIGKGFKRYVAFRGFLTDAETIVTVVSAGLAVGANVATILVSREAFDEFVATIHDWIRSKAAGQLDGRFIVDVSARQGDVETRLRLQVSSTNGMPQVDTTALNAFITSLFPGGSLGKAEDGSTKST